MCRVLCLLALLCVVSNPALAFDVGERVRLEATRPSGVPLHSEAKSSMFGRAPTGSEGEVLETANNGRWNKVELDGGRTAWIIEKYLRAASGSSDSPAVSASPVNAEDERKVWSSESECRQVVEAGGRLDATENQLRIATWNIRWFPEDSTDLEWLSCALAWLNTDIIAVQEITATRGAFSAMESVTDGLTGFVGGDWKLDLHGCGRDDGQHVGFLWNADKVSMSNFEDRWRMNGAAANGNGSDCDGSLRPGRSAYASVPGGVDLHLVSVHLDSGVNDRDYNHRKASIERIGAMHGALQATVSDADVLVLGDYNTMGTNSVAAGTEILESRKKLGTLATPHVALVPDLECSEYFEGKCGLLDHFVLSKTLADGEGLSAKAVVTGYCKVEGGKDLSRSNMPAAYKKLSDHCPVVISLQNTDQD